MSTRSRESSIQNFRATAYQRLGKCYGHLERHLQEMPPEALEEFNRLMRDFDTQLDYERQRGREDAHVRGKIR